MPLPLRLLGQQGCKANAHILWATCAHQSARCHVVCRQHKWGSIMWGRSMLLEPCQMAAISPQLGRTAACACGMCTPIAALHAAPSPPPKGKGLCLSLPSLLLCQPMKSFCAALQSLSVSVPSLAAAAALRVARWKQNTQLNGLIHNYLIA